MQLKLYVCICVEIISLTSHQVEVKSKISRDKIHYTRAHLSCEFSTALSRNQRLTRTPSILVSCDVACLVSRCKVQRVQCCWITLICPIWFCVRPEFNACLTIFTQTIAHNATLSVLQAQKSWSHARQWCRLKSILNFFPHQILLHSSFLWSCIHHGLRDLVWALLPH